MNLLCKLSLLILISIPCYADAYEEALKVAAKAAYIQSGYDKMVDNYIKNSVPKEYIQFAERWSTFAGVIVNQKLELEWKF